MRLTAFFKLHKICTLCTAPNSTFLAKKNAKNRFEKSANLFREISANINEHFADVAEFAEFADLPIFKNFSWISW